jgi:hypothetical protein
MEANRLQQAIGQGIAQYNTAQDRDVERRQLEAKAEELDLSQGRDVALMKQAQGLPLTPQDNAYLMASDKLIASRPSTDVYGNVIAGKPLLGGMGRALEAHPVAAQTSLSVGVPVQQDVAPSQSSFRADPEFGALGRKKELDVSADIYKKTAEEERNRLNLMKYGGEQLKAANFANRMNESTKIIDGLLEKSGGAAREGKTGFIGGVAKVLTALPLGDAGTGLGEAMIKANATPQQQQYLNAAQNWVSANLRKESGAAIRVEEMAEEYAKYFPMPLDSGAVKEQKAKLRKQAEKGMIGESAGSYQLQFGKKAQANKKNGGKVDYKTKYGLK